LPGHYFWVVGYSGDDNYSATVGDCGALNEDSLVKTTPTIATEATGSVAHPGMAIRDTATLSRFTTPVTGTVTFRLFGPSVTPLCTTTPVFTSPAVSVTPDGMAMSPDFLPSQPGSYYWVATYSGDANNTRVTTRCGDKGETTVVEAPVKPGTPVVDKRIVSVVAGSQSGTWTVTYTVTVANRTHRQLSYSLIDEPGYPAGVTITSVAVSRVHSALNGSGATAPQAVPVGTAVPITLATGRPLPARSKDSYTVGIGATVSSGVATGSLACTGAPGHGWFNAAKLTRYSDPVAAQACHPITAASSARGTPPTPPTPPSTLPFTGLWAARLAIDAIILLGAGGLLLRGARLRRRRNGA
jgi:hypothetical protein